MQLKLCIVPLGFTSAGQQFCPLLLHRLDHFISAAAGHFPYQAVEGRLQVIAGMTGGLFNVLPGALLYPQQTGNAPMLFLAGTFFGELETQQVSQFFLRSLAIPSLRPHPQITAFAFQKLLGQLPALAAMIENQLNQRRRTGIAPGHQVLHGPGTVTLEKGRANGPNQCALA